MLVASKNHEVFNYSLFFEQFPDANQHIFRIREIVHQYAQNDGPSQEIPNNVNESDNDRRSHVLFLVEMDTNTIDKSATSYNVVSIKQN